MTGMGDQSMASVLLSDAGMNMTNSTVAMDFLGEILDDSDLQPVDIAISQAFWYGITAVIGIATFFNLFWTAVLKARYYILKRSNISCQFMLTLSQTPCSGFEATVSREPSQSFYEGCSYHDGHISRINVPTA